MLIAHMSLKEDAPCASRSMIAHLTKKKRRLCAIGVAEVGVIRGQIFCHINIWTSPALDIRPDIAFG